MIPALQQAALDPSLRGRTFQVYVFLCGQLDTYEFRPIKITAHCKTLQIKRPNLSLAINTLIDKGYLDAKLDQNDERRRVYRLFNSVPQDIRKPAA
jgi:DNA-binding MarR family transcriptional regulator